MTNNINNRQRIKNIYESERSYLTHTIHFLQVKFGAKTNTEIISMTKMVMEKSSSLT